MGETTVNANTHQTNLMLIVIMLLFVFSQELTLAQEIDTVSVVEFQVRTTTPGGNYSPKNIGAIWVEDAAGVFVKSLTIWAQTRRQYLSTWNTNTGGNDVDAVTGATSLNHVTHYAAWDFTDVYGNPVETGDYTLQLEMTDEHSQGPQYSFTFPVGSATDTIFLSDQTYFHDMYLYYTELSVPHDNQCYELTVSNNWQADLAAILADLGVVLADGDTLEFVTNGGNYGCIYCIG